MNTEEVKEWTARQIGPAVPHLKWLISEHDRLTDGIQKALDNPNARAYILEHTLKNGADNCCEGRCQGHSATPPEEASASRAYSLGLARAADIAETKFSGEELVIRGTGYDIAAAIRAEAGSPQVCEWTYDDNEYAPKWDSSCGEAWCFIDGGPVANRVRYCHGCGKAIAIKAEEGRGGDEQAG